MKEIGGYFGLERFSSTEYHHNLIGVNSGRNALLYILKVRKYRKLYIPRFLCDSVSGLCRREGYEYEEYAVGADFLPEVDGVPQPDEAVYVVNYYGQISDEQVLDMKKRWGNLIFDNVQAFFRRPAEGVDTVYSCRKFFGVPDGGYVSCDTDGPLGLEEDRSGDRMKHILGRFEENARAYYGDFQLNDEKFCDLPLRSMSPLTRNIMRGVDYEGVRNKRNENYALLQKLLGGRNPLKLTAPDGPYVYPFYCRDGMSLKKKLAERNIYVATLWPNVLELDGTLEKDYAENILPLPCDQRYGELEIKKIEEEIVRCLKI